MGLVDGKCSFIFSHLYLPLCLSSLGLANFHWFYNMLETLKFFLKLGKAKILDVIYLAEPYDLSLLELCHLHLGAATQCK